MSNRSNFFHKKTEYLTVADIVKITNAKLSSNSQEILERKIFDVATLEQATCDHISFFHATSYLKQFQQSQAGFCLIEEKYVNAAPQSMITLSCTNPYFAYSQIITHFYEAKFYNYTKPRHNTTIGEGSTFADTSYIGANVKIGKNCHIAPNAVVADGVTIGDNCIVGANCVISFANVGNNCIFLNGDKIGQDGFGFAHNKGVNHKILQIGLVEIGNDVEIGANSCIDRGALENTIIGDGVKIDNLVQIGHNVTIGKGTVMAGCSAIAGSAKIGNFVQIGGSANIAGHITIGDGVKIAGASGVMRDVKPMETIGGIPAIPIRNWHKLNAKLLKLADLDKNKKTVTQMKPSLLGLIKQKIITKK